MGIWDKFFGKKEKDINYNQAVFTSKQAVDGTPILLVIHDEDGEWQFLTGDTITEADIMLVSVAQIIQLDGTLKQVLEIEKGISVTRQTVGDRWVAQRSS